LLDQVIPRLASHWGRPVVHGSCVEYDGSALVFVGPSGAGKSTLATFLHKAGLDLLSDDGVLLDTRGTGVTAIPGYQGARLWEDAYEGLELKQEAVAMAHYSSKKRVSFQKRKWPLKLPLQAVFVLDPGQTGVGSAPSIQRITGTDAAMALLRNAFYLDPNNGGSLARVFDSLASVAADASVAVFRLSVLRGFEHLPKMYQAILEHVEAR